MLLPLHNIMPAVLGPDRLHPATWRRFTRAFGSYLLLLEVCLERGGIYHSSCLFAFPRRLWCFLRLLCLRFLALYSFCENFRFATRIAAFMTPFPSTVSSLAQYLHFRSKASVNCSCRFRVLSFPTVFYSICFSLFRVDTRCVATRFGVFKQYVRLVRKTNWWVLLEAFETLPETAVGVACIFQSIHVKNGISLRRFESPACLNLITGILGNVNVVRGILPKHITTFWRTCTCSKDNIP
jgi:hypothetical protein